MTDFSKDDIERIRQSGLFDAQWYLKQYPDVKALGMDPAEHYLWLGAKLGRNPGPKFDSAAYLNLNADVAEAELNPLVHYERWGKTEGRNHSIARVTFSKTTGQAPTDLATILRRIETRQSHPTIIVPIYGAPNETERCIESLLVHTPRTARIVLIDDASPDERIRLLLNRFERQGNIHVLYNKTNLGFTRTINRGIEHAKNADVVFLNSDTVVTPHWLRNLQLAAYSDERVATATPFSNNAGAFSAPQAGVENPLPDDLSLDQCARLVSRTSKRNYPAVPTGNGFCMYVRRDCIDEIGLLDAEAFPRGYGEENDFCLRASRAGWSHVIDDDTFIFHSRSASFGNEKAGLMAAGRAVLNQRYPEYTAQVRDFLADPKVTAARARVGSALNKARDAKTVRPRVLYVISTRTGGTPHTNEDLMTALEDRIQPFVLHCDSKRITLFEYSNGEYIEQENHTLGAPIHAFPHRSDEYDAVIREWLLRYGFELVHVRHIAWHGLGLIDEAARLGMPVAFSFHDFYTVCPTVNLLDDKLQYCFGRCSNGEDDCQIGLWKSGDHPPLKHRAIHEWRTFFAASLQKCSLFFTTTESTKRQLLSSFPFLEREHFIVIPHGRDFDEFYQLNTTINKGEKLRVLIPGNLSPAKGGHVVEQLARKADEIGIELHILGKVAKAIDTSQGMILHGAYDRDEFPAKVQMINPHIGAVFSICAETYCHTLTELWACGLPALGFPLGAVQERLERNRGGWICADVSAEAAIHVIEGIKNDPARIDQAIENVVKWQNEVASVATTRRMADSYLDSYRSISLHM